MIILDFASGSTCQNDIAYIKRMIDELRQVDTGKHEVIIKWQLFEQATVPYVPALSLLSFREAYTHAASVGYKTTASVFDTWSLGQLLEYDVPFVKFACREWVYPLIGAPSMMGRRAVVSIRDAASRLQFKALWLADCMCCVPKYPASVDDYYVFGDDDLVCGISDHTVDWTLYKDYTPDIYECHYKLEDSTGPDAGAHARTPEMLREVL